MFSRTPSTYGRHLVAHQPSGWSFIPFYVFLFITARNLAVQHISTVWQAIFKAIGTAHRVQTESQYMYRVPSKLLEQPTVYRQNHNIWPVYRVPYFSIGTPCRVRLNYWGGVPLHVLSKQLSSGQVLTVFYDGRCSFPERGICRNYLIWNIELKLETSVICRPL